MPKQNRKRSKGQKTQAKTVASIKAKRKVSPSFSRAKQRRRDIFRGSNLNKIVELQEQEEEAFEESEQFEEAELDPDTLLVSESDIIVADEDGEETIFDQTRSFTREEEYVTAEQSSDDTWRSNHASKISIVVVNGKAIFRRPDWVASSGEYDMNINLHNLTRITDWLNQEKGAFIRHPTFFTLTQGNVDFNNPIPVLQEGLHTLLELEGEASTFSKSAKDVVILWPKREMPLESLWSSEAKLAWCAQATIQRQKTVAYISMDSPLGRKSIQPPQKSEIRNILLSKKESAWRLGPVEFAELLCALTVCKWRDVLKRYGKTIFYRENVNGQKEDAKKP